MKIFFGEKYIMKNYKVGNTNTQEIIVVLFIF